MTIAEGAPLSSLYLVGKVLGQRQFQLLSLRSFEELFAAGRCRPHVGKDRGHDAGATKAIKIVPLSSSGEAKKITR
jgi:hypothetical protein